MKGILKVSRLFVIAVVTLWIIPSLLFVRVRPGDVGVRQSNLSGVIQDDLEPGWALRLIGMHKIIILPTHYNFLEYSNEQRMQIRTQDNNIVYVDVSVPYRIIPGEAFHVVEAGNHIEDSNGRFRFQRLAEDTTVSTLRKNLAKLGSSQWYSTDERLKVSDETLGILNESLASFHLEAERVLIRAVAFRAEYEQQLTQIQLNEQNKLLDEARQNVANKQQTLDNYAQGTNAQAAAREQDWIMKQANLDRAYQVGFILAGDDNTPGAARRALEALTEDDKKALKTEAAGVLFVSAADDSEEVDETKVERVEDHYLLGIKNIEAETLEYDQRIRSEADGVSARLSSEGGALVAQVRGAYEAKVNALLNSSAGRAYVAWKSAANVKFADRLVFSSRDGIPSILQLRRFARAFMGGK